MSDPSRPTRDDAIINIDKASKETHGLTKAIEEEFKKTKSVALKDKLQGGCAIAIAETLNQGLPKDCDDAAMWLDINFDALLKCEIAMTTIGTICKIIAIAHGGNTEATTEQYPRALTL